MESAREPGLYWAFLSFYSAFVVKTGRQWSKNKRRQQRGREGWKRCRKRGDISLLSYGRVIAGVELCCKVLENHLLDRKVTASKMLAWRWRYVLWLRAGPGDGFLPIVFCCGVMVVPWWYCTSVPWVNLTRDHRYWPSWAAVSDMQKRSWENTCFLLMSLNIVVIQRGLLKIITITRCWGMLCLVQLNF